MILLSDDDYWTTRTGLKRLIQSCNDTNYRLFPYFTIDKNRYRAIVQ